MNKAISILFILFFACGNQSIAQKIKVDKAQFEDKKQLRSLKKSIRKGNHFYRKKKKGSVVHAIPYYEKAYKEIPENTALNYKLGKSFLQTYPKRSAKKYLEKAYEQNDSLKKDMLFDLAKAYQYNYNFDKAIKAYSEYKQGIEAKKIVKIAPVIDKKIKECIHGKEIYRTETRVIVEPLDSNINSIYPEYRPCILPDESELFYTSRKPVKGNKKISPIDNLHFENIFSASKKGKQFIPDILTKRINSKNNDAVAGISSNGQNMIVFRGKFGGDLFLSKKKGDKWKKPKKKIFKKYINTVYTESSVSYTFDNKYMFFVSNRKDLSYGGKDIFISKWNEKRKYWSEPLNLGNTINTKYDEEGVFIHPDGKTLYFSSKGHSSIGGYDVFSSTRNEDGSWTEPKNLGFPLNTTDDDLFLVLNANGRIGYYSSIGQDSSMNFDIYKVIFLGPEKPLILSSEDNLIASIAKPITETTIEKTADIETIRLTILKGIIHDAMTKEPLEASIEVVDNQKNEQILTSSSNSSSGKYLVSLPSGKNYGIAIKVDDYLFHSENLNIPPATEYQEITKDIPLYKIEAGSKIVLANIFFDFGKSTLSSESFIELDRVVNFLNTYSSVTIEISGHTDNVGSLQANTRISTSRAKSVVEYLIEKGIESSRLKFVGEAFKFPVATNDTEEGRQRNRRVEFKILSK
jgi:outer membrane protein OmpA-like peptidoglycan-associated protein